MGLLVTETKARMKTRTAKGKLGMRSRAAPSNHFMLKIILESSKAAIKSIERMAKECSWLGFG
jgi:hypothetical protein